MNSRTIIIFGLVALVIVGFILITNLSMPGNYDSFAQCLTSKGAKLYGAYWCPHCLDQKKEFGNSVRFIDYVECDAKGTNGRPDLCQQEGILGYPTWIINGKKYEGSQTFGALSQASGCPVT
ncbi:MAG: hypothetical protein V1835_07170 [Candidatus Micrarchaeota archaeon]